MKSKCTGSSISRTSFFTPCTRIVRFCYNVFRRPGFMPVINEYHGASSKQLLQKSVPVSMLRIFRAGTGTATLELWLMLWVTPVSRLENKMHAYNTTRCRQPGAIGFLPIPLLAHSSRVRNWTSRSEEHTSELQSRFDLVCRLQLEKKNISTICLITYSF